MTLQLGDTFNIRASDINSPNSGDTTIVVDSVFFVQSEKRIRFKTPTWTGLTEPITFFEGIGPNYSLFWITNNCQTYENKYLLCVFKDSIEANYSNLRFNGLCSPNFASIAEIGMSNINIDPNPFSDMLNISISQADLRQVDFSVYNILGQIVYNKQGINLNKTHSEILDLRYLPNGIYFVQVALAGERVVREVVKQ
jgi:hypothetical protein